MNEQPPKWALWFLEKTCADPFLDELEGDLFELFDRDVAEFGVSKAKRKFIWNTFFSLRWYRLPGFKHLQTMTMYNHHFKVAIRHAAKYKSATTIQFLGLLLGIAAAFYIGLFLKSELAFDQMHVNSDSLYRVLRYDPTSGTRGQATSSLHGETLKEEFPFISVCRFGNDPVKIGDVKPILVEDFFWADSTFFELFTFKFIHGNPATCLDKVNSLVITRSKSLQLFNTENALGKTIKVKVYDGNQEFLMVVNGIVEDPPKNSHIQFSGLGAMANAENLYGRLLSQWGFSWLRTYIQVPDNRMAEVKAGIPNLIKKNLGDKAPPQVGIAFQDFNKVYLYSQSIAKNTFAGSIKNLRIFAAIGCLILLISLMNYVNLATARAVTRTKEIGVRKVLGSQKGSIISQFMVESILFMVVSGLGAIALVSFLLPQLNDLVSLDLSLQILAWSDWAMIVLALISLGFIVGILPALAMAKLPSLSDNNSAIQFKVTQWSLTRKLFVGVQYAVTLVLLVATLVIYNQYEYLKNFDKGFDSSQLLHLAVDDRDVQEKLNVLKEKISQIPNVLAVTATGEDLPSELNNTWDLNWNGSNLKQPIPIDIIGVDQDYFNLLAIDLKAGRNFTNDYIVDSARSVILNEKAFSLINKADMLGQQVTIAGRARTIIGVAEDHHHTTLHAQVAPTAYFIFPSGARVSPDNLFIKLKTDNIPNLLSEVEAIWQTFSPDPLVYNFVDEAFAAAYATERKFSVLIGAFTFLAIIISIIGLFGLINFVAQLKLKEISIRRILGATQFSLLHLLGKDFLKVFLVALILALPTAYYFATDWLTNYAYHIELNGTLLILATVVCIGISILVIFYQLLRTTRSNPSEVLASD